MGLQKYYSYGFMQISITMIREARLKRAQEQLRHKNK